jgi:CBS domain containing-hemolysin-like protein
MLDHSSTLHTTSKDEYIDQSSKSNCCRYQYHHNRQYDHHPTPTTNHRLSHNRVIIFVCGIVFGITITCIPLFIMTIYTRNNQLPLFLVKSIPSLSLFSSSTHIEQQRYCDNTVLQRQNLHTTTLLLQRIRMNDNNHTIITTTTSAINDVPPHIIPQKTETNKVSRQLLNQQQQQNGVTNTDVETEPISQLSPRADHLRITTESTPSSSTDSTTAPTVTEHVSSTNNTSDGDSNNKANAYSYYYTLLYTCIGIGTCLMIAAIAAGLTLGMLGIDTLFLLIKQRATTTSNYEKHVTTQLLLLLQPLSNKHLLLVTLLICNAIANEVLPLLLEKIVPSFISVILSVTFVLFFGEIIPSAIFTGPNQLMIAYHCIPFVKCMICILYPIAKPIALLLDHLLHCHENDDDHTITNQQSDKNSNITPAAGSSLSTSASYTRGELAALIRIQYEDRVARKRQKKQQIQNLSASSSSLPLLQTNPIGRAAASSTTNNNSNTCTTSTNLIGAIDFTPKRSLLSSSVSVPNTASSTSRMTTNERRKSVRALLNHTNRGSIVPIHEHLVSLSQRDMSLLSSSSNNNGSNSDRSSSNNGIVVDEEQPLLLKQQSITNTNNDYDTMNDNDNNNNKSDSIRSSNRDSDAQWHDLTIHHDEIMMMEGALQMQTTVALDVYTSKHRVYSIPSDTILNEYNIVQIYASGYSRIPVHLPNNKNAIIGILFTKYLIVINPKENRCVNTIPLRLPRCVSPSMPLVNLLNMFQLGGQAAYGGGHLALVCAQPSIGERVFYETSKQSIRDSTHRMVVSPSSSTTNDTTSTSSMVKVLPEEAGYMGIITLEDVLEMLLQEHIYDEMDKVEQNALRIIVKFIKRWRRKHQQNQLALLLQQQEEQEQNKK